MVSTCPAYPEMSAGDRRVAQAAGTGAVRHSSGSTELSVHTHLLLALKAKPEKKVTP